MHALRVSLLVGILAVAVVAAGCGGSDDEGAATTATDAWADGVCSALTTWTTSIASAAASLGDGGGENALEEAVADVEAATRALGDDLDELGTPDTEAGAEAKDTLEELAGQLEDDVEGMQEAASDAEGASATLSAFSTISGTLATMGTAVASTFEEFEQLDAKGELSAAFSGADSCTGPDGRDVVTAPVLVGYDGSTASEAALERGIAEAQPDGHLVVVVVTELPLTAEGPMSYGSLGEGPMTTLPVVEPPEAEHLLATARERVDAAGLRAEYVWDLGDPTAAIVREARDRGAAAIVVGKGHHTRLGRWFGTDTAAEIERTAGCRVVVVDA